MDVTETMPKPPRRAARSSSERSAARGVDPALIAFGYACVRDQLRALRTHQPPAGAAPSPEAVHKLRIAARRARVALRTFKQVLPAREAATLRAELRWFARSLGEVRDLDVYVRRFEENEHGFRRTLELERYARHVRDVREAARARLPELFAGRRYRALLEKLDAFLADAPPAGKTRRPQERDAGAYVEELLGKSAKRVMRAGDKVVGRSSAAELHRFRLLTKRLRYELELFAAIHPSLGDAARLAKRLQDVLGAHQDACVAAARVREYLRSADGEHAALRALLRRHQREAAAARRAFAAEWAHFKKNFELGALHEPLAA